jgi:hypothetical protein
LGKVDGELPELLGCEAYNEKDLLHWDAVTPHDVMARINMCKILPVLPSKGISLTSLSSRSDGKKDIQLISINEGKKSLRKFQITVEELPIIKEIEENKDE